MPPAAPPRARYGPELDELEALTELQELLDVEVELDELDSCAVELELDELSPKLELELDELRPRLELDSLDAVELELDELSPWLDELLVLLELEDAELCDVDVDVDVLVELLLELEELLELTDAVIAPLGQSSIQRSLPPEAHLAYIALRSRLPSFSVNSHSAATLTAPEGARLRPSVPPVGVESEKMISIVSFD